MLRDFRTFITRGNVVDLAVGIVNGAAFGAVVASFAGATDGAQAPGPDPAAHRPTSRLAHRRG